MSENLSHFPITKKKLQMPQSPSQDFGLGSVWYHYVFGEWNNPFVPPWPNLCWN